MHLPKKDTNAKSVQDVMDDLLLQLHGLTPDDPAYAQTTDQLVKLHALRENEKSRGRVSPDTLLVVGSNVAVALIVVAYEQKNVITTKALSFMSKLR